jgi:phage FluMu protein Com
MKRLIEWECPFCGIVHVTIQMEDRDQLLRLKCPICGTLNSLIASLCSQPLAKCVEPCTEC